MLDAQLLAAYHRTTYGVETPALCFRLRIGARNHEFDELLRSAGVTEWAFITAGNPRSQQRSPRQNKRRHARLLEDVRTHGYEFWPGLGIGDDGGWPPEESLLIRGITREAACEIGQVHDQNAIVAGRIGETAELIVLL